MNLSARLALLLLATTSQAAPACDLPKPTDHEISNIRLGEEAPQAMATFELQRYTVRMRADDLLPLIARSSVGKLLQARLPLEADVSLNELIAEAAPEVPEASRVRGNDEWRQQKGFIRSSNEMLRQAAAELLEKGKVSIIDRADNNKAVTLIQRDKYGDCAGSGRKFTTPQGLAPGIEILHVNDGMA